MNISTKLQFSTLCSILATIIIGTIIVFTVRQIQDKSQHVDMATDIVRGVFTLNLFTTEYLLYHEERPKKQWEFQYDALTRFLEALSVHDPGNQALVMKIRKAHDKIKRLFSRVTANNDHPANESRADFSRQLQDQLQGQLLLESQNIIFYASQLAKESEESLRSVQKTANWLILASMSMLVLLIGSISFVTGKRIVQPIVQLQKGTEIIGAGNLEFHVETEKNDEIGLLSQSFKRMVEQLKTSLVSRNELEKHVTARTAELAESNRKLEGEITERKQTERELQNAFSEIQQLKEQLEADNVYLREEVELKHSHQEIIGSSEAIKQVLNQIEDVAETNSTALITGETGTGKELIARAIHRLSSRKDRPMVKVNCAALPPNLIESELFGREKGAYTGALTKQAGRFEVAHGATIFLDEIGDLPPGVQAKLLRVLQDGQFERLGSTKTITVDVRVIAATNLEIAQAVAEGRFREDLYYRLNVFPIAVPPLRERRDDIPLLVWAFVREFEKTMGKKIDRIPKQSLERLQYHPWHGNIRELKNIIEHAMIVCKDNTLRVDLSKPDTPSTFQALTLEEADRQHILHVLEQAGWRIRGQHGAAEILGLKPTTLSSKMQKLGIKRPDTGQ